MLGEVYLIVRVKDEGNLKVVGAGGRTTMNAIAAFDNKESAKRSLGYHNRTYMTEHIVVKAVEFEKVEF